MDLDNLIEIVVYHFLIGGITCLDCWDEISTMSALVCMVTHWIRLTMNHEVRLLINISLL